MRKIFLVLFILIMCATTLNAAPIKSVAILKSVYSLVQESLLVMFIFFLFSKSETFKNVFADKATLRNSIKTTILFTIIGIYGTTLGIPIVGAISNIRDTAPFIAGFIGGPIIGIITGFLAGLHRFLLGGFTQWPCSLATLLAGVIAGFLSSSFKKSLSYWMAITIVVCLELFHMILILLLSKPYANSIALVKEIILPMVLGNAIGIFIFVYILRNVVKLNKE